MKKIGFLGKERRWVLGVLLIVLITIGGGGVTYAYNQHNATQDNRLKAHRVAGEIIEKGMSSSTGQWSPMNLGGETEKKIQFRNNGETAVFVRVSFSETWLSNANEWLETDAAYTTLNWTDAWADEWQLGIDGWYYYKKLLKSNTTTAEVLASVEFEASNGMLEEYQDAIYQLFFTMEVVQYSKETAVNILALKQAFNREATVTNDNVIWN
jgi:hypothetical protein